MPNIATGTFRLKGSALLKKYGSEEGIANVHQLAIASRISYPAIHRWMKKPEMVKMVDLETLYGLLVDGLGFSPEKLATLPFAEVFEAVEGGTK